MPPEGRHSVEGKNDMSKRILTVDDSRTMREMVAMTLRNAGFHVIQADDGVNALKVLADNEVDIIITDLNMPNMDGLQLVKALRAKPEFKGTPILFLTTRNTDSDKQQGRAAGATGWITKPFDPQRLLQVVNKVCP
jgi:two-component system, chemotaxis family, chemotaxis protein CheY